MKNCTSRRCLNWDCQSLITLNYYNYLILTDRSYFIFWKLGSEQFQRKKSVQWIITPQYGHVKKPLFWRFLKVQEFILKIWPSHFGFSDSYIFFRVKNWVKIPQLSKLPKITANSWPGVCSSCCTVFNN